MKAQKIERTGVPADAIVTAKRLAVSATGLQDEHDDEDHGDEHRRDQAEVRALLGQQLGELPFVDLRDCGDHATASSASPCLPSVMPRKSSSRLAVSGTSAVTPIFA